MKHSLFVHNDGTGRDHELAMYHTTRSFPDPHRYLQVLTKQGRVKGYLPLDTVGSEYDSGLRWTEASTGTVYQVCSKAAVNVFRYIVRADNAVVVCTSNTVLRAALRSLFEERVGNDPPGDVLLTAPAAGSGVTQALVAGLNLRIGVGDAELSTLMNGLNISSFGGDSSMLGRTMLVRMSPPNVYRLSSSGACFAHLVHLVNCLSGLFGALWGTAPAPLADDTPEQVLVDRLDALDELFAEHGAPLDPVKARTDCVLMGIARVNRMLRVFSQLPDLPVLTGRRRVQWEEALRLMDTAPALNALIFGKAVEALPRDSASFASVADLLPRNFAVFNPLTLAWDRASLNEAAAETVDYVQRAMLSYTGSRRTYNYFELREPVYADTDV